MTHLAIVVPVLVVDAAVVEAAAAGTAVVDTADVETAIAAVDTAAAAAGTADDDTERFDTAVPFGFVGFEPHSASAANLAVVVARCYVAVQIGVVVLVVAVDVDAARSFVDEAEPGVMVGECA